MYGSGGHGSRSQLGWLLVLALLLFFFCAQHSSPTGTCAEISDVSEVDWPALQQSLQKIEDGLNMTDAPLSSIESSFAERELALQQREQESNVIEQRLNQREQGLNEREKGLEKRELLYSSMRADLEDAKRQLKRGWLKLLAAALVGAGIGYLAGR